MATYYVDRSHPSASDDNAGTSESLPWLTLHRATDGYPSREVGGVAGSEPYSAVVAGDTVYVKNGTYEDKPSEVIGTDSQNYRCISSHTAAASNRPITGGSWATYWEQGGSSGVAWVSGSAYWGYRDEPPRFGPINSGTAGNPITFRAYPGHAPVVTKYITTPAATPQGNETVIGASSVNYITWDGFTTGAYTDIRVISTTGTIIENCTIDKGTGVNANGTGNYCGIFTRTTTNCIIRNNTILNVNDDGDTWQAVGIVAYDSTGLLVYNNEIGPNVTVCMHDKRGCNGNSWYLNWCHETTAAGIGFMWGSSGSATVSNGVDVYNNVFDRIGDIGVYSPSDANSQDIDIHNNTFRGIASSAGMRIGAIFNPNPSSTPTIQFYNNLIMRDETAVGSNYGHLVFQTTVGPPADLLCDYNAFYGIATTDAVFRPAAGGGTESFATWQGRGYDGSSITGAPTLVGPFPATSAAAYKPDTGSPLLNAGRTGGTGGGSVVNIGAYETGNEVIGVDAGGAEATPAATTSVRWYRHGARRLIVR